MSTRGAATSGPSMLARELLKEGLRSQVRTGAAYCPRRIGGAFLCRCPAYQQPASNGSIRPGHDHARSARAPRNAAGIHAPRIRGVRQSSSRWPRQYGSLCTATPACVSQRRRSQELKTRTPARSEQQPHSALVRRPDHRSRSRRRGHIRGRRRRHYVSS
jgi:hypothetical protein